MGWISGHLSSACIAYRIDGILGWGRQKGSRVGGVCVFGSSSNACIPCLVDEPFISPFCIVHNLDELILHINTLEL